MLAGRPTALWAGLVTAVLNVVALVYIVATHAPLDETMVALFAGLNALALAVIGLLANNAVTGSYLGRAPKP